MDEANVSGPIPDPEMHDLDSAGWIVLPWVKYPNLRQGSMGWRMGAGKWHISNFKPWWWQLAEAERASDRLAYPPPPEWYGFNEPRVKRSAPDTTWG